MFVFCVFFFKQKTAYEMRISDWSSDVCSSDLSGVGARGASGRLKGRSGMCVSGRCTPTAAGGIDPAIAVSAASKRMDGGCRMTGRSEEHTSELQSLMRISYAVFCLKKKKKTTEHTEQYQKTKTTHNRNKE